MNHTHSHERPSDQANSPHLLRDAGFVRLHQILQPDGPLPISKSSFWAGVKNGKFPQPRKISPRVTVWCIAEINALLAKIEKGEM